VVWTEDGWFAGGGGKGLWQMRQNRTLWEGGWAGW